MDYHFTSSLSHSGESWRYPANHDLSVKWSQVRLRKDRKSILVVDDDESILISSRAILEAEGYSVDTAETGREAIELSNTKDYNLALLDYILPDIEGTILVTKLRKTTPRMKKIIMTGFPSVDSAVESLRLRIDDYVVKPIDPKILLKIIEEKLEEQEAEELTLEALRETLLAEFPELPEKIGNPQAPSRIIEVVERDHTSQKQGT